MSAAGFDPLPGGLTSAAESGTVIEGGLVRIGATYNGLREGARQAVGQLNSELKQAGTGLAEGMRMADGAVDQVNGKVSALRSNLAMVALASTAVTSVVGAITLSVGKAMAYEQAFANVRKTVHGTDGELAALSRTFEEMSKRTVTSAEGLAQIAAQAGAVGVASRDIATFVQSIDDLTLATDVGTARAVQGLGTLGQQLDLTGDKYGRLASTVVALSNSMAAQGGEILQTAERSAQAAKAIGLTPQQLVGYSAAVGSLGGIEPESAGNALQKLFSGVQQFVGVGKQAGEVAARLGVSTAVLTQNAVDGSDAFDVWAKSLGMTTSELRQLIDQQKGAEILAKTAGMTQQAFSAMFEAAPSDAMRKFLDGLGKLDQYAQQNVLKELGFQEGTTAAAVLGLANNTTLLNKALNDGSAAWDKNTAAHDAAGKQLETTASRIQMIRNSLSVMQTEIGEKLLPPLKDALVFISEQLPKAFDAAADTWHRVLEPVVTPLLKSLQNLGLTLADVATSWGGWTSVVGATEGPISGVHAAFDGVASVVSLIVRYATTLVDTINTLASLPGMNMLMQFGLVAGGVGMQLRFLKGLFGGIGAIGGNFLSQATGGRLGGMAMTPEARALTGAATSHERAATALSHSATSLEAAARLQKAMLELPTASAGISAVSGMGKRAQTALLATRAEEAASQVAIRQLTGLGLSAEQATLAIKQLTAGQVTWGTIPNSLMGKEMTDQRALWNSWINPQGIASKGVTLGMSQNPEIKAAVAAATQAALRETLPGTAGVGMREWTQGNLGSLGGGYAWNQAPESMLGYRPQAGLRSYYLGARASGVEQVMANNPELTRAEAEQIARPAVAGREYNFGSSQFTPGGFGRIGQQVPISPIDMMPGSYGVRAADGRVRLLAVGNNPQSKQFYLDMEEKFRREAMTSIQRVQEDIGKAASSGLSKLQQGGTAAKGLAREGLSMAGAAISGIGKVFWPLLIADMVGNIVAEPLGGMIAQATGNARFQKAGQNGWVGLLGDIAHSLSGGNPDYTARTATDIGGKSMAPTLFERIGTPGSTLDMIDEGGLRGLIGQRKAIGDVEKSVNGADFTGIQNNTNPQAFWDLFNNARDMGFDLNKWEQDGGGLAELQQRLRDFIQARTDAIDKAMYDTVNDVAKQLGVEVPSYQIRQLADRPDEFSRFAEGLQSLAARGGAGAGPLARWLSQSATGQFTSVKEGGAESLTENVSALNENVSAFAKELNARTFGEKQLGQFAEQYGTQFEQAQGGTADARRSLLSKMPLTAEEKAAIATPEGLQQVWDAWWDALSASEESGGFKGREQLAEQVKASVTAALKGGMNIEDIKTQLGPNWNLLYDGIGSGAEDVGTRVAQMFWDAFGAEFSSADTAAKQQALIGKVSAQMFNGAPVPGGTTEGQMRFLSNLGIQGALPGILKGAPADRPGLLSTAMNQIPQAFRPATPDEFVQRAVPGLGPDWANPANRPSLIAEINSLRGDQGPNVKPWTEQDIQGFMDANSAISKLPDSVTKFSDSTDGAIETITNAADDMTGKFDSLSTAAVNAADHLNLLAGKAPDGTPIGGDVAAGVKTNASPLTAEEQAMMGPPATGLAPGQEPPMTDSVDRLKGSPAPPVPFITSVNHGLRAAALALPAMSTTKTAPPRLASASMAVPSRALARPGSRGIAPPAGSSSSGGRASAQRGPQMPTRIQQVHVDNMTIVGPGDEASVAQQFQFMAGGDVG